MNFKLIDRLIIKNPTITLDKKALDCFLYQFKEGGFSEKQFTRWLRGKVVDVHEYTGRFGRSKNCPWCKKELNKDLMCICMAFHSRNKESINTIKLSNHLYKLLLSYLRNGSYDALGFLVHRECSYCERPNLIKGREGKCAIPESTRSRPRSLKLLGFSCENFSIENYSSFSVAIIYRRNPV